MKRAVITGASAGILLGSVIVGLALSSPPVAAPRVLPACVTEDSSDCIWDAQQQGNGSGQSFVDLDGNVFPVSTSP